MVPVLVGLAMGKRWADAGENFYSATSQAIATLFIAIAVGEFFAREASEKEALDGLRIVLLIGVSWLGFFACIRALAGDASSVTSGLAGAGVTAASVLVSLSLYDRIKGSREDSDKVDIIAAAVVILFLAIPVSLLIF